MTQLFAAHFTWNSGHYYTPIPVIPRIGEKVTLPRGGQPTSATVRNIEYVYGLHEGDVEVQIELEVEYERQEF